MKCLFSEHRQKTFCQVCQKLPLCSLKEAMSCGRVLGAQAGGCPEVCSHRPRHVGYVDGTKRPAWGQGLLRSSRL